MRIPLLPIVFLLLPLAEIAGFVLVGSRIGVLPTIGLVMASAVLGMVLLRVQGIGALRRAQAAVQAGRSPGQELAHGAMIFVAAILLLIPGFLTDLLGLLLFIPAVRDFAWRRLGTRLATSTTFQARGFGASGRGRVVDLDAEDYARDDDRPSDPGRTSPWRRIDNDPD